MILDSSISFASCLHITNNNNCILISKLPFLFLPFARFLQHNCIIPKGKHHLTILFDQTIKRFAKPLLFTRLLRSDHLCVITKARTHITMHPLIIVCLVHEDGCQLD